MQLIFQHDFRQPQLPLTRSTIVGHTFDKFANRVIPIIVLHALVGLSGVLMAFLVCLVHLKLVYNIRNCEKVELSAVIWGRL